MLRQNITPCRSRYIVFNGHICAQYALPQLHMNPNHKRDWSMYKMIGSPYFYNVKSVGYYCAFCRINSNNILVRNIFMVFLLLVFCCFDFRCSCFRLVPKTLTAQWNQPPWCWSVLRFISFRLGNAQQLNLKVLKSIWLLWFFVGFMVTYCDILCQ